MWLVDSVEKIRSEFCAWVKIQIVIPVL